MLNWSQYAFRKVQRILSLPAKFINLLLIFVRRGVKWNYFEGVTAERYELRMGPYGPLGEIQGK